MGNTLMGSCEALSGSRNIPPEKTKSVQDRVLYAIYALALAASISPWFIAIRAPLWLDETHSFFVIRAGFSQIMSRMGWPIIPIYSYILWLSAKVIGTSEIALRVPSILAMFAAVYLLYLAARELFDRDVAVIAAVVFCLHPVVVFAAIDVRPYAFAVLTINASILALVHLRHNHSNWLAALFGLSTALIGYFQFLFVIIIPALAICFFAIKVGDRKTLWRQAGAAFAAFALALLPVISVLQRMFQTKGTHVFEDAPTLADLLWTLAPVWLVGVFVGAILVAAATRRLDLQTRLEGWRIVLCTSLALTPILVLYVASVETPIHVFAYRYRLVAIPGIALCWGWLVSRIDSRVLRLLFCVAVVAAATYSSFTSPFSKLHGYTWKYALEFVEKNASADGAPVLICSDFPEADVVHMPVGAAVKDSGLFAPLTYYQLSVPVVGLPRALNDEAIRVASRFLLDAAMRKQRFVFVAFGPSAKTLDWLADSASPTHNVRKLGVFEGIIVVEFIPRVQKTGNVGDQ